MWHTSFTDLFVRIEFLGPEFHRCQLVDHQCLSHLGMHLCLVHLYRHIRVGLYTAGMWERCHDPNIAMDYTFSSIFSLVLLPSPPLLPIRTILYLLIHVDSRCMIVTHPRTPILDPEGCTMTHGLIPWLTLFVYVCYRLCVLNYKYPVVAVVGP